MSLETIEPMVGIYRSQGGIMALKAVEHDFDEIVKIYNDIKENNNE